MNPDERVWGWTKYGRLANLPAENKEPLWEHVVEVLIEVKYRPDLLKAFIRQTELPGLLRASGVGTWPRLDTVKLPKTRNSPCFPSQPGLQKHRCAREARGGR